MQRQIFHTDLYMYSLYGLNLTQIALEPDIQHRVPGATREPFGGKQTVPTFESTFTGLTSLNNAISFLWQATPYAG